MKIFITGGAGFIGSNFIRLLLNHELEQRPTEITVLDSLTYSGNLQNLAYSLQDPRLTFIQGDICDASIVEGASRGQDILVNFAAESHVDRSISDSVKFVKTNVLGTQVLLEAARKNNIKKFIQISTDEVYGSIENGSWNENYPINPNSPYAATKAAADLIVRSYWRTHDLDVCITRCSNNYGPLQFPEKVIPLFITNLMDNKNIPIYGDGKNIREWIHVDDHCRGISAVISNGKKGDTYNIGSRNEVSNNLLSKMILKHFDLDESRIDYVEDRKGHDFRYSLDTTKIESELGFKPKIDFETGLSSTIEWYRNNETWWRPLLAKAVIDIS
jgi:dTDP-glucose 4,6-dehydratase